MSVVKDQTEKKRLSLKLDRRNTYGEDTNATRKGIPLAKQRQHQGERRSVSQTLHSLGSNPAEDHLAASELLTKIASVTSKQRGFKKRPDESLGIVLANKRDQG